MLRFLNIDPVVCLENSPMGVFEPWELESNFSKKLINVITGLTCQNLHWIIDDFPYLFAKLANFSFLCVSSNSLKQKRVPNRIGILFWMICMILFFQRENVIVPIVLVYEAKARPPVRRRERRSGLYLRRNDSIQILCTAVITTVIDIID